MNPQYALEIIENAEDYEILSTNLQPFFWRKVKTILRQNKKAALQEFLFGYDSGREQATKSTGEGSSPAFQQMEDKIQNLHNQVNSLQKRILQLENQIIKMAADTNLPSDTQNIRFNSGKRSEQGDSLKQKKVLL